MRFYECGNRVAAGLEECPTCHAALWAFPQRSGNSLPR